MTYITKEDVAAIRKELKEAFPKWKFSVSKGSGSLSVDVYILKGTVPFQGKTNVSINKYWIEKNWQGEDLETLNKIDEIMHNAPGRANPERKYFNDSDSMTDYFHTAFYTNLSIGKWNNPYSFQ